MLPLTPVVNPSRRITLKQKNMNTIYLFLADGFEDVEALGTVDILRRAGLHVRTVSIMKRLEVHSAHGITVRADELFEDADHTLGEMLILPGGMPGASHLKDHNGLRAEIRMMAREGKSLAAICAAPMVYGDMGLLAGRRATCYPGFEKFLQDATYTAAPVEQDGNFITGKGPGVTFDFALAIVAKYCGDAKVAELRQGMMMA